MYKFSKIYFYIVSLILSILFVFPANGQIRTDGAFINTAPPGSTVTDEKQQDSAVAYKRPSLTFKQYFRALAHKDSMKIAHVFAGSIILPGTAQIYNRQAWKLPIVYGGIGGFIGGAVASNIKYQRNGNVSDKNMRNVMIAGAAATYYWSLMDGVISFKSTTKPLPARATLLSALLPGLGQAYNGDYWHIPIFYGGFAISGYCWSFNQKQYKRYRNMYIDAVAQGNEYNGKISLDDMIWYRDSYRRLRDYSIIATGLIYVLNIIDSNVFAHFNDFDIDDDISLKVSPAIIEPVTPIKNNYNYYSQSVGISMNLNF